MIHDVKSRIAKLDFRPVGLDSCYLHTYNLAKLQTNPSKWWSKHVKTIPLVKIRGFRHVQVMLYILVLNRNASNLGHQQKLADIVYKKTRCQTFWVPHTSLSFSVVYSIGFLHHYIYIYVYIHIYIYMYGIIEYEHNLQYIKSPKNIPKHPRCFRCPAPCLGTLGTCSWSFCLSSVSSVAGGSWRWRWLVNGKNGEMGLPHHDYWVLYHDIIYTYLYMI